MNWSAKRQLLYGGIGVFIVVVCLVVVWQLLFTEAPSCFDHVENDGEQGVDCGGPCATLCAESSHPPLEEWAAAFITAPQVYTAAAYIKNENSGAGAYNVPYEFDLYDAQNDLIVEKDGVVDIPPEQTVPIIENGINVGNRTVARTFFEFKGPVTWERIPQSEIPDLRVEDLALSGDGTRLSATVANEGNSDVHDLEVDAVLFDAQGNARAASKSLVPLISAASSAQVVFTWPRPNAGIVKAEITPVPSLPYVSGTNI